MLPSSEGLARKESLLVDLESDQVVEQKLKEPSLINQVALLLQTWEQKPADVLAEFQQHSLEAGTWSKDVTGLLGEIVRPAFVRSRPQNITAAGRQAVDPGPQSLTFSDDEESLKPWKFKQQYAVEVLAWLLEHSDGQAIQDHWHLITPPVLTLIDDEQTTSKITGCELLQILLKKAPQNLWARTGLGTVFEQAILPTLAYLPPLTPQDESMGLLGVVYPTLLALCKCQFSGSDQQSKRAAILDELLRFGVLGGISQAGENVRISIMLLEQLDILINEMGIQCVKHLKTTIPVLTNYLCDPFAIASVDLLVVTNTTLQTIILNAWPRMEYYCAEILKSITVCWTRLGTMDQSISLDQIESELRVTLNLLKKCLGSSQLVQEMETLINGDEKLTGIAS